jgi:hypothetical protein
MNGDTEMTPKQLKDDVDMFLDGKGRDLRFWLRFWTWYVALYPRRFLAGAFLLGAAVALAVVGLNADALYQWYWRVWVYRP